MNPRHLLRMARWAHKPPSMKKVIIVFGVIATCLSVFVIERFVGWPEALTVEKSTRVKVPKF